MGFNRFILPMLLHLVIALMLSSASTLTPPTFPIAMPGCKDHCGNVSIPFPFGITEDCYLNKYFFINCTNSSTSVPQPVLQNAINVTDISLEGQVHLMQDIASDCYDKNGSLLGNISPWMRLSKRFTFSSTANKFIVVGCDALALVKGFGQNRSYATGCIPSCDYKEDVIDGSCSGIGCCRTDIPPGAWNINVSLTSLNNHTKVWDFNPCSYAFVVEEKAFNFSASNLTNLSDDLSLPVVVDWTIEEGSCEVAQRNTTSYACSGKNSHCYEPFKGLGYRCSCDQGYEGNPYLPDGCQDIDECQKEETNNCKFGELCINVEGGYNCSCPKGYLQKDDGKGSEGCIPQPKKSYQALVAGAFAGAGVLFLVIATYTLYKVVKRRRNKKRQEKFFKRNGGLLLQHQLSADEGGVEKTMLFSAKELNKASDGFNENRILGQGGQGTVYKGMLTDGRIVAIKKSKKVDENQLGQFINEVVLLSQINHRNVVKLLGCCLETEVPLLVYEFIPNGTLFTLIHNGNNEELPLTWNLRLRIAIEVAGALAYLHSAVSIPIYHRDIKSSNILLDEKYIAKVSDFGTSRSVTIDKTHLTTVVKGTFGYLDPEYFQSSQFTEKSDVYSFGVVLAELLTRQKPISSAATDEDCNLSLATRFLISMEQDSLRNILDPELINQGNEQEITAVAKLAQRCLNLNGKKRPTMKEVAIGLESMKLSSVQSTTPENFQSPSHNEGESVVFSDNNYTWTTEGDSSRSVSDVDPLMNKH
ncbi:wall-associated receptor kinase-like 6 [Coffea arabica]|uniref:Wall-associated receptor kinase-like 6 n=2 Tax=Coffea arabica TaxID=13443 RepID=A0A6P6UTJ1_COFAR